MPGTRRSIALLGALVAGGAVAQGKETGSGLPTAAYNAPRWHKSRRAEVTNKTRRGARRRRTRRRS